MTRQHHGGCAGVIVALAIVTPFWALVALIVYLGVIK